jgi:hypothetical protein
VCCPTSERKQPDPFIQNIMDKMSSIESQIANLNKENNTTENTDCKGNNRL